jgi:hypothetical protein
MTLPTVVDTQYNGTVTDFLKTKCDRSGAARVYSGVVSVPSGTAANAFVGLVPFNKGARFHIDSTSIYAGNFGAADTTLNIGYIYSDNVTYTNDVDAWASLSAAPQSGGFVSVDEFAGLSFVAAADGWVAAQLIQTAADATADITFQFTGAYDGLSADNQNNQS